MTGIPNYPKGQFFRGYSALNKKTDNFEDILIHRIPLIPRGDGRNIRLILNFLSFAILGSLLAPFYCNRKFDIIFVYEPSPITVLFPALILKFIKKTPIIFWMQDLWPESLSATGAVKSNTILKIIELAVRFLYKGCDRILAQSKGFIPSIIQLGGNPDRIIYYPNSAEPLYRPLKLPVDATERSIVPNGFRIIFAGNIGASQDFDTILTAAEQLMKNKNIHWIILGDGRMSGWVQSEVNKRGLNDVVHLLGRYPVECMPRFFALADALLVTLKKEPIFALTIPSKIQTYLACGRPVIAGLDGEGARIIDEAKAGITCSAEDPVGLSKAVIALI